MKQRRSLNEIFAHGFVIDDLVEADTYPTESFAGIPSVFAPAAAVVREAGVTLVSPTVGSSRGAAAFENTVKALAQLQLDLTQHGDRFVLIRNYGDIEAARRSGKLGVLVNIQSSDPIGTALHNLDLFYGLGLRQGQLTHNWRNWVGDGCTERTQAGLTYFGVDLVRRMNELGIIVDVSHSGYQTTLDAVEASSKPIVFSHTNCKALCDHPRNKSDLQIRALAKKGGVMGISCFNWFVSDKPRSTLDDVLDHFDHVIKLVGPDHVGIGSDFGLAGWPDEPAARWESRRRIYTDREWKELKGRFPPFIAELNNPGRYRSIARGLEKRGHPVDVIEKALGLNFLRVFREVLEP